MANRTASKLLFQKLKSNRDWEKHLELYANYCVLQLTVTTWAKHQQLTAQRSNSSTKKKETKRVANLQ